jgi:hypothetical protein
MVMLDFIDLGFKNDGICNFVGVGILSTNHKVPGLFVISRYWYVIFTLPSNNRATISGSCFIIEFDATHDRL